MKLRINPVLKNEGKLGVRTWKFPLMVSVYVAILSVAAMLLFWSSTRHAYYMGLDLKNSMLIYLMVALAQSILLMFIVPSMSASAISGEREKQTLEVLLSTKMSSFSIIIGKLFSSVSKVILLIFLTLPVYGISFLIGGVDINNIVELALFFLVTTFFVGAIGIFFSTFLKSSKGATAATYGTVLLIFLGVIVGAFIIFVIKMRGVTPETVVEFPKFAVLSPVSGMMSLFVNQLGAANVLTGPFTVLAPLVTGAGFGNYIYYSLGIMVVTTVVLVIASSIKLNPLYKRKTRIKENKK